MSELQGAPERRGAPSWLIGCGLVFTLLILAGGGGIWYFVSSSFFWDKQEVSALAESILPGARAPEGYEAVYGMDVDMFGFAMRMAVMGPPGMADDQDTVPRALFIVATGDDDDKVVEEMSQGPKSSKPGEPGSKDGESQREYQELGEEEIVVGGRETLFRKTRVVDETQTLLRFLARLPGSNGKTIMLMILGVEEGFDRKAMDTFLAGIGPLKAADAEPPPGEDEDEDEDEDDEKTGAGKGK